MTTIGADVAYIQVAAQMVLLGTGLGLTTAPATESIMGVVRPEQAGAGSALNDATRQVGGTLGVAVLGSIYSTLYLSNLNGSAVMSALPAGARQVAAEGVAQGLAVAQTAPAGAAPAIRTAGRQRLPRRPARRMPHRRGRLPARSRRRRDPPTGPPAGRRRRDE